MEIMQQLAAATATALCLGPEPSPTTATAAAQMEAAIATLHGKKQRLREAYDSLVLHSPIPLPFRWSDLDAHLSSLQSSILARFSQLQALQASRPAPPAAAAASHGEGFSEDVEMKDVHQQGEEEEEEMAAAAKMAPPSTLQVKEEPVEAAACASMDATRLSNPAGKRAVVGQDGFVRPGGMAAPAAAKMAPPSKVQVKEEPVEVSPSPPGGATGLTAACASMDAPKLDVCKRAGGGQDGCARHGTTQSPPIPSCPVLQQQHMAGAPNGSHPVLRQHAANAMNTGHSAFRPQQHMGKPRDASDLQKTAAPNTGDRLPLQRRQQRVHANLTYPLPLPVVAGSSPPQQRVGVFPSPPLQIVGWPPPAPPSQARVGEASLTNPSPQQFTASAPYAGDGQLQKRPPWQRQQRVSVASPMNAGDLPPQKPQFTASAPNAGEHPFQERQQPPPVAKPKDDDAGGLLPQQQQQFMANAPNAGEHLLPEQQKQQLVTAAKPTNAPLPGQQHAANATNPVVLRRQRQRQWVRLRPPTAANLPQTEQEQHQFMADGGTNARNPPQPPCGMVNPPISGDLPTDQNNHQLIAGKNQQLMTNTHSASAPVSTPLVASNQSESAAMTTTKSNQNSGGPQPVAAGAAPNPAGNQQQRQQGQRKGGANRRGGRGQGNKNNNIANTNISNMSKVIGKGNKGNGNPQLNKNGPGDHQKNKNAGQLCYRCGCRGHWSRICRTPEQYQHLSACCKQYQHLSLQAGANTNTNTIYVGAMTD